MGSLDSVRKHHAGASISASIGADLSEILNRANRFAAGLHIARREYAGRPKIATGIISKILGQFFHWGIWIRLSAPIIHTRLVLGKWRLRAANVSTV